MILTIEKELKENFKKYIEMQQETLNIAKKLISEKCIEIEYLEIFNQRVEDIYQNICRIIETPIENRIECDKEFLLEYIGMNMFVDEHKYRRDCIIFIARIDIGIKGLEQRKDENINKYGEASYNFTLNLYNLIKSDLDMSGYNDLYSYSLYNLFTLIRDFYIKILL